MVPSKTYRFPLRIRTTFFIKMTLGLIFLTSLSRPKSTAPNVRVGGKKTLKINQVCMCFYVLSSHGIYIPNGCKYFKVFLQFLMKVEQTLISH